VQLHLTFNLFHLNRNIIWGQSNALQQMDLLDPALFKRMFRVDREMFLEVVEKITPFMAVKNNAKARNSSGSPI
jgi:hypothetical protein